MKVDLSGGKSRYCWYEGKTRLKFRIRMRSLAERNVAWMLDTLGVLWWYERRMVRTSVGWYRPDFLVKLDDGQFIWIEVKGPEPTVLERKKCQELARISREDVYCVWDGGAEALLFRAGGGAGESVGGLSAVVSFEG